MSSSIIINSTNAVQTSAPFSSFQYNFPGNTSFNDKQLLLSGLVWPFSNFNVNPTTYQNANYQIIWIDGTVLQISMPAGFYAVSDISNYLIQQMIAKTWYTVNSALSTAPNTNNYYLGLEENQTYYSVQLNSAAVPTAAQAAAANITLPPGATWAFPAVATNPQFVIQPFTVNSYNTSFSDLIGFSPQTWPTTQTPGSGQSLLSNFSPELNPVSTIVILCSLINNTFATQNQILYAFAPGNTAFGSYVSINPPQEIWLNCSRGMFSGFTLTFVDQTLRFPVPMNDPSTTIILSVRDTPDNLRGLKQRDGF